MGIGEGEGRGEGGVTTVTWGDGAMMTGWFVWCAKQACFSNYIIADSVVVVVVFVVVVMVGGGWWWWWWCVWVGGGVGLSTIDPQVVCGLEAG